MILDSISPEKIHKSQEGWGFLRNRKPGSYGDLSKGLF